MPIDLRRLSRFSLRTMFVLMAAASLVAALVAGHIRQIERQRAAIDAIHLERGTVHYDFEWDVEARKPILSAPLPGPRWLRESWGIDYVADVVAIRLAFGFANDESLKPLKELKSLAYLDLSFSPNITNAGLVHLRGLKNLRYLEVGDTQVTAKGMKTIRAAIPKCVVCWEGDPQYSGWKSYDD